MPSTSAPAETVELTAAEIRAARPPLKEKEAVDAWRPQGVVREEEPEPPDPGAPQSSVEGVPDPPRQVPTATVFLTGAECPFTCAFCDLWRYTLDGPTPPGALPAQLDAAWDEIAPNGEKPQALKLYNASNFFDPRAVPPEDLDPILDRVARVPRVVVENHPRLTGRPLFEFAEALAQRGSRLEVAMGLETVHPEVFPRLNKGARLDDFEDAARRLIAAGIGVRVFVLVGTPWIPESEQVHWAIESARWAFERGAGFVALIPLRSGNGTLDRLAEAGELRPPTLAIVEDALSGTLQAAHGFGDGDRARPVVVADPWDLEPLTAGSAEPPEAIRNRILHMNRHQLPR